MTLADKGDWVGAADRFARAYSLKPTFGIAFNWASALVELNKLLEAQELLHGIVREPSADAQIKRQSEEMLESIDKHLAHIHVRVVGDEDQRTSLLIDGALWPRAAWNLTSPINPGRHLFVLKLSEIETSRTELVLSPGDSRDLVLYANGRGEEVQKPLVLKIESSHRDRSHAESRSLMEAPKPLAKDDDRRPLRRSWILWSTVGAVVAGGVVAAVMLTRNHGDDGTTGSGGVIVW